MEDFDIAAELRQAIMGAPLEPGTPVEELVLNHDQATEWLAQLDSVRARRQEVVDSQAYVVAKMNEVTKPRIAALDAEEAILEEALGIFHSMMVDVDKEHNLTIPLPTGVLKSGTWGGDIWEYDEVAFQPWAMEHLPGAVDLPEPKILKGPAEKLIKEATLRVSDGVVQLADGTTVPGLKIKERPRSYKAVTTGDIEREAAKKAAKAAAKGE